MTLEKDSTKNKDAENDGKMRPINRDGNQGEDTDADGEDRYVAAKFAEDQTCRKCHHIQSQSFLGSTFGFEMDWKNP